MPACRALLAAGLAVALLAAGRPGSAQGIHPLPPGPRALHLRLAEADAVAIGTVSEVGEGRIAVRDAEVLRGEVEPAFEIKRSPSRPPPLATGLQAVLLLRGARSPYLLVDAPRELVVLRDEAAARAWRAALGALFAAGSDRERLRAAYLGLLDSDLDSLRESAGAALLDPRADLLPLSAEQALACARAALDPARPVEARRSAALLATSAPAGADALLVGSPGAAPDAQVVELALRAGVGLRAPALGGALERALASGDPEVRRAGLAVVEFSASDALAARVKELAANDADQRVRRGAQEVLGRMGAAR